MKFETRCTIPADPGPAWDLLMDIPRAAPFVPGLQEIVLEGPGHYRVTLKARVGPMGLNFSGTISVLQQDRDQGEALLRVEGSDRRVGGAFRADMTVTVKPISAGESELAIFADTAFMGKLGELGQPIIRRKAATTIEQFAKNLAKHLDATAD